MTMHDRATTVSMRQKAAADLAKAGYALFGPDWKAPLAAALIVKTSTIDDMSTGRSRIPPGMWNEIAGLLQGRERLLPTVKAAVLEHLLEPEHRLYRGPGGIEFRVFPNAEGNWPTVQFISKSHPGKWDPLDESERRIPDHSGMVRLEYKGVLGFPSDIMISGLIHYPKNFIPMWQEGLTPAG